MAEIPSIVAATDFSPAADRAARRAASLASTMGGTLHLVHVLPPPELLAQFFPVPSESEIASLRKRADDALQERAHRIAAQFGITPSWALFHGHAHRAILDAARLVAANIVVVGAQGEHEGAAASQTIGETALKIAAWSGVAILLVRREVHEPYCAVMACAKGAPIDRRVIEWANRMSPANLIHIVSAYTVPYEERLTAWGASQSTIDVYATRERDERSGLLSATLSGLGLPAARARLHLERDAPLQAILRNAARGEADLIVVGRRAQADPLGGGDFGSVARHVAFLAPVDVMIVPPKEGGSMTQFQGPASLRL